MAKHNYIVSLKYDPFEYPFRFERESDATNFLLTALNAALPAEVGNETKELVVEMKKVPATEANQALKQNITIEHIVV